MTVKVLTFCVNDGKVIAVGPREWAKIGDKKGLTQGNPAW